MVSDLLKDRIISLYHFLVKKDPNLLFLGGLIGLCSGLSSEFFRWLILFLKEMFFYGRFEILSIAPSVPWYFLPLIPMAGGLIIGPLSHFFPTEAKGHGVPEVMQSIALKNGIIKPRTILLRTFASAVCIGSGGSAGREGPIVQIGSSIGSALGQLFNMSAERIKILVGCGAAGGIAATFNAPLAGVIFSMEIILGVFSISTFTPIVISSVTATVVSHAFHGNTPAFIVPSYQIVSYWEILFYIILGLLSGLIAWFYIVTLYWSEDYFEKKINIHPVLKPEIVGLLIGCLAIFLPQIMGNGYEAMDMALNGQMVWYITFILIFMKIIATSITLGSGGSGGVFAPSLFIGAMLGGTFGSLVHFIFPDITATKGAYALVGMGSVIAAAAHAPMTNILILFELTNDYKIILPIMASCIIATSVVRYLSKDSIYTLKLRRRGINIQQGREVSIMGSIKVGDVMDRKVETILETTPFKRILAIFSKSTNSYFPVVNSKHKMVAILSFSDIREVMFEEGLKDLVVAKDLAATDVISLSPKDNLNKALEKFVAIDVAQLPVVDSKNQDRVIGMLSRGDLISAYNKKVLLSDVE
ncbi:MAG: chloride channel protein [Nitrospinota bacterium]|nr:chloride channel protein [Nitrospinota bacterium]